MRQMINVPMCVDVKSTIVNCPFGHIALKPLVKTVPPSKNY